MPTLEEQIEKIVKKRIDYIDDSLNASWSEMANIQKELTVLVLKSYLKKFDTEAGLLKFNTKNLNLINELDSIFTQFSNRYSKKVFKDVGMKMLDMVVYSEDYFRKFGSTEKTFSQIESSLDLIAQRIGITPEGKLIKNSYIDRLATSSKFKEELKDFVAKGLAEKTSLKDFQAGFLEQIEGTKEVDSKLLRYWKTETHDAFFSVSRAHDDVFAKKLRMDYFLYLPGKISTSRDFCIKKVGKCFHRKDMEKWKQQDWAGKNLDYNPIRDMGGHNCMHSASWISSELAKRRYPDKYNEYE